MVRADILNPVDGRLLESCTGPDQFGDCPRQAADGLVACAGKLLDADAAQVGWALQMRVGGTATRCPLRCFVLAPVT